MGLLTLSEIISRATEIAGGRLDWGVSDVSFYANRAYNYVMFNEAVQHRSLESSYATTITSGVSRMALPADYNLALALSIGSSVPSAATQWRQLTKRDIGWADNMGRFTTAWPECYVEYGTGFFEIVPSPNSSYSLVLRFRRRADIVSISTDSFLTDPQWDWAIVLKTAELLAMSRSDIEMEQLCRNRYIDYMSIQLPDQAKKWMDQRGAPQQLPRQPTRPATSL